ncbi:MAG: DUF3592 domain-containing protein [Acidobacteriota bacterium]
MRQRMGRQDSLAARLLLTVILAPLAALGTLALVSLASDGVHGAMTYPWRAEPCLILTSAARDTPDGKTVFDVSYSWAAGGRERVGTRYALGYEGGEDPAPAQRLAARFVEGDATTCYVDPRDPSSAVLVRWDAGLTAVAFVARAIFGVLFLAGCGSGVWVAWRGVPPGIARATEGHGTTVAMFIMFGAFALMGGALFLGLLVFPLVDAVGARGWHARPCTIDESRVTVTTGRDSEGRATTSYGTELRYHYEVDGRVYRSRRLGFVSGSSGGQEGQQAIVDRFPAGSSRTCYVDPRDPTQAVLDRSIRAGIALARLHAVPRRGNIGLVQTIRGLRRSARRPGRAR